MVFKPQKIEIGQLPYRFRQSFSIHTSYNIWLRQIIAFICFYKTPYCLYHFIAISPWDIIHRHEYTAKSQIYTKILNKKNRIQNTKLQNSIGFDKCSALDLIFIDSTIQIYQIKKFSLLKML